MAQQRPRPPGAGRAQPAPGPGQPGGPRCQPEHGWPLGAVQQLRSVTIDSATAICSLRIAVGRALGTASSRRLPSSLELPSVANQWSMVPTRFSHGPIFSQKKPS